MKYLTTKGIVLIGLLSTNLHISEMVICIKTTKIDATLWMKIQYMLHVLALTDQINMKIGGHIVYTAIWLWIHQLTKLPNFLVEDNMAVHWKIQLNQKKRKKQRHRRKAARGYVSRWSQQRTITMMVGRVYRSIYRSIGYY